MAEVVSEFSISVDQVRDYEFLVKFDKEPMPELRMDEPPPLGRGTGPSAARVLAAAIGNCLSASLLFCSRKARVNIERIHTEVKVQIVRDENKRLRVGAVEVTIDPHLAGGERDKAQRCLGLFEDFCTVTQSIRRGIDVQVTVEGFDVQQPGGQLLRHKSRSGMVGVCKLTLRSIHGNQAYWNLDRRR